MAIFGPRANMWMNLALIGTAGLFAMLLLAIWVVPVMGYNTQERYTPEQPVPFSHRHHVGGLGLDCRYCHTSVEISQNAGIPPTETCMTCHSQIWTNAAILAPVRQSLTENRPLRWSAVYELPDYVYFDHSIHIAKGVGCTECHGPIGDMALTWKATTLYMAGVFPATATRRRICGRRTRYSIPIGSARLDAFGQAINGGLSHPTKACLTLRCATDERSARHYWQTLEELAETPEFGAVEQEAPRFRERDEAFDRRRSLQLMAASMASGGVPACGPEPNARQLLPYVVQPPGIVPGNIALLRDGNDQGGATQAASRHARWPPDQGRRKPGSSRQSRRRERHHAGG